MKAKRCSLEADASAFVAACDEMRVLLKELSQFPVELSDLLLQVSYALPHAGKALVINIDGSPAGADKCLVGIEPSDGFLECLATARALKRDLKLVDCGLHDRVPLTKEM